MTALTYIRDGAAIYARSFAIIRAEANLSEHPRWSIISCYSSQANLAYNETSTAWKTPVEVVPDEAILEWEAETLLVAIYNTPENVARQKRWLDARQASKVLENPKYSVFRVAPSRTASASAGGRSVR